MVYQTDFLCTYRTLESDDAYRSQLLQAFGLNEYDFDKIEETLTEVLPVIEKIMEPVFKFLREEKSVLGHLLLSISPKLECNLDLLFCLCSIETFDYTHALICTVINNGNNIDNRLTDLIEALKV